VRVSDDGVTFTYKDYADGGRSKEMTLPALEFVRRFAMHVVPGGLVRIRQYGLLANRGRGARLAQCRRLLPSAPTAGTVTPSSVHDYRWLILMTLVLATATPAALAHWSEQLLWPHEPVCTVCGSRAVRTLWQAPRPGSRRLPTLASWAGPAGGPPVREDSS
jgi:hypothetical protein